MHLPSVQNAVSVSHSLYPLARTWKKDLLTSGHPKCQLKPWFPAYTAKYMS